MSITSANLSTLPFIGSCDSTRTQMAAKQKSQALTHPNCEIPYVISDEYRNITATSDLGILIAKDDGQVYFNNCDIIIIYYKNLKDIVVRNIPIYKNTAGLFSSKLRFSLPKNTKFKKGDVVFSYDNFRNGVPSFGYNTMTAYFNFFGFNHEDSLVFSESFNEKAKMHFRESIYVPIYEYTVLQPLFQNDNNSLHYFPNIGQKLDKDGLICSQIKPNTVNINTSIKDLKNKMLIFFNNLNVSDLINIHKNQNLTDFSTEEYTSKLEGGKITGLKVYRLNNNIKLIDNSLQTCLEQLFKNYCDDYIVENYSDLVKTFGDIFARQIARSNLLYTNDPKTTNNNMTKNAVYLLEFEITKEDHSRVGDKFCNRYAGKGVTSLILPDELRPVAVESNIPIDCIFNSFGVFSRMNISQVIEGLISKEVMKSEHQILKDENKVCNVLENLNQMIIKNLNSDQYYNDVSNLIKKMRRNKKIRDQFIDDVKNNGLFIEAPAFSELEIKKIINNSNNIREKILIKKETLQYLKDKLKVELPFQMKDIYLDNIFCAPIYTMKLHKLAHEVITSRDLGKCKFITKQPLKGKASGGGMRLGQMEIDGLIGHGCTRVLKELITVKSDWEEEKQNMLLQLIEEGEYNMNDEKVNGGTKRVVNTLIEFLND